MKYFFENAHRIIAEAAKDPMGIFALMILVIAFIAFFYFYKASEWIRGIVFVIMLIGVALFGFLIFHPFSKNIHLLQEDTEINYAQLKYVAVTASGYYNSGEETFPPERVVDGNTDEKCGCRGTCRSYWLLPDSMTGYIKLAFKKETKIHKIKFLNTYNRECYDRATTKYHIAILPDINTEKIIDRGEMAFNPNPQWNEIEFEPTKVTGIIFYVDSYYRYGGGLNEIQIY